MKRNQFFSCKGIQMMLLAVMMLFGYSTKSMARANVVWSSYKVTDGYLVYQGGMQDNKTEVWAVAGLAEGYDDKTIIRIPAVAMERKVIAIAHSAFRGNKNIESVMFETGAKVEIEDYAFANCSNLYYFAQNDYNVITYIGDSSFKGCTSLKEFTIAPSVEEVGDGAFYGSGLKNIKVYATEVLKRIGRMAFAYCQFTSIPTSSQLFRPDEDGARFYIEDGLFAGNPVRTLDFPFVATRIPKYCFQDCKDLMYIKIDDIVEIGDFAFSGCTNISNKSLTIGPKTKVIGRRAFRDLGLTSLTIGSNGVTNALEIDEVGSYLFDRFGGDIKSITFTDDVKGIADKWARNCSKLTKVTFPSVLTDSIGDYAFENCPIEGTLELTGDFPVLKIGKNAFAHTHYSNIVLKNAMLGESVFSGCKPEYFTCDAGFRVNSLDGLSVTKNLSIPNLNYAEGVFDYANIKKLTVTGTSINGDCMKNNTNINRVVFPNATSITGRVLEGSSVEWVAFPKLESISQECFGNAHKLYRFCDPDTYVMTNHVNNGHIKYTLGGGQGTVYSADGKTLLYVLPGHDRIYLDKDVEYIDLNGTDFKRENDVLKWGALVIDATAINHKIKLIGDPEQQACCRYLHIGLGCRKYFEDFTKMRYAPMLVQDAVQGDVNEDGKVSVADVMNVYDQLK